MSILRRAAKQDANQKELVESMQKMGAHVIRIGDPFDLLVTHRGRHFVVEVKASEKQAASDAKSSKPTHVKQRELREDMTHHGAKVWTVWEFEQVREMLA